VTGFRRRQQRAPVARIEHQMIDDLTEKVRSVNAPGFSRCIAMQQPRAFARGNEHQHPTRRASARGSLCACGWHFLSSCGLPGGLRHDRSSSVICFASS
jgi:hypothetical protein